MPYAREGAIKVSDHWLRSPLTDVNRACQTCHRLNEKDLIARVELIQDRTFALKQSAEKALVDAIDAIAAADKAGASEESLKQARHLYRRASMRWDLPHRKTAWDFTALRKPRASAGAIDYGARHKSKPFVPLPPDKPCGCEILC
jgi:nitrite reductase (cytochrome c-552)